LTKGLLLDVDEDYRRRIDDFKVRLTHWRSIRQPASTGSQQYDMASLCVLTWIWTACSGIRITTVYPFVTNLLSELFQMQELLDNSELKDTAQAVLGAIASLPYPIALVRPMMSVLTNLLRTSPSWRVRLDVLPVLQGAFFTLKQIPVLNRLQVFYFNQLFTIEDDQVRELLETLCTMLSDSSLEVREAAAASLSGIVRCSQRHAIIYLKDRFLATVRQTKIPRRRNSKGEENPKYQRLLVEVHSGVLGAAALINAHPYGTSPCFL
jgi:proteasome activator subunit 4